MLEVEYSSDFIRKYKKLPKLLKEEVKERIEYFKDTANHQKLRVHALKSELQGFSAFSINYRDRIIFQFSKDKKVAYLLNIGDHSVYE
jgi:mRNA-degrading endonuclease YafQ of YafQ-DinJ toxin-antitoxin module